LGDHGVTFAEKDIQKDEQAAHHLSQRRLHQRLHGDELPVVEVDGVLIQGFNPRGIQAALDRN
jgi:hypothetical protein